MGRFCFHLFTIFKTYRSSKLARWVLGPTVSAYGWLCHVEVLGIQRGCLMWTCMWTCMWTDAWFISYARRYQTEFTSCVKLLTFHTNLNLRLLCVLVRNRKDWQKVLADLKFQNCTCTKVDQKVVYRVNLVSCTFPSQSPKLEISRLMWEKHNGGH